MLEDRSIDSCLLSRVFSSSCLSDSKWLFMYAGGGSDHNLVNGKRSMEVFDVELRDSLTRRSKSLRFVGYSITEKREKYDSSHGSTRQHKGLCGSDDVVEYSLREEEQTDEVNVCYSSENSSGKENERSDSNSNGGDSSASHPLIQVIGWDNSINCLIRCSRFDYGSIASLNRSFRSLVRTGEIYRVRRQNGLVEHWVYFSCQLLVGGIRPDFKKMDAIANNAF